MMKQAKVKVKDPGPFRVLYDTPPSIDFIIAIGGRGGKKTYEISKAAAFNCTMRKKRIAVLRDEKETIRDSILNEIFARYDTANVHGHFNGIFEKLEIGIRDLRTGNLCVTTKGFRASSNDKKSNLKGISDIDVAIVEEAEDIRSFEKFNTFRDSVRTQNRLIVVILNTPDIQHWIVRRYFNLELVTEADIPNDVLSIWRQHFTEKQIQDMLDGYWKLKPKSITGFHCIQTSYLDNQHLPQSVIRDYTNYGIPTEPTYDLHYYLTAILGFASSGRKGQVLKKVKQFKLADYLALPFREITGLDFGTSAPAGIAGVKIDGNNLYAREINYKPLDTLSIGRLFRDLGYGSSDLIVADSADPISIGKLRRGWPTSELDPGEKEIKGFHIRGAVKGPGSIEAGLGMLNSMNLYFCEESENLWNEVYNYIYATNKEGEYTNIPEDSFNHLIDPIRYVAQSRGRFF